MAERNRPEKPTKRLIGYARDNRNEPAQAEHILWLELRNSKIGHKFSRQIVIGSYIADFCCRSQKVVVELDGSSHESQIEEDEARDRAMTERGYLVLRISNDDVYGHIDRVVERIKTACDERPQWRY